MKRKERVWASGQLKIWVTFQVSCVITEGVKILCPWIFSSLFYIALVWIILSTWVVSHVSHLSTCPSFHPPSVDPFVIRPFIELSTHRFFSVQRIRTLPAMAGGESGDISTTTWDFGAAMMQYCSVTWLLAKTASRYLPSRKANASREVAQRTITKVSTNRATVTMKALVAGMLMTSILLKVGDVSWEIVWVKNDYWACNGVQRSGEYVWRDSNNMMFSLCIFRRV